jgi:two-component system chemotaxis sensor kinase CheA
LGEIVSASPVVGPGGMVTFEFMVELRDTALVLPGWKADGIVIEPAGPAAAEPKAEQPATDHAASLFIAPSHIVRVDLSRLDDLMRIAGELVIQRSRLEDRVQQADGASRSLKDVNLALARSLRDLREAITRIRLVPIAEIFTRMPFVVRDLARESGKKVRLVVEGQHTEIDKFLVERLKEPLLHLVRNAFSHGIETPAERTAAGKPAEGTIHLSATAEGESVSVEIRDDGRGLDPEKIVARAAALNLPVPDYVDGAALLALICAPGFSTREEADRASGRGVGMAVVQATVRELGGTLSLQFVPGGGTRFHLRLPLTLSIVNTFIVSAGPQTCAIPQSFIQEIVETDETQIKAIKQTEVIAYRDGLLPLVRLRTLFGDSSRSPRKTAPVLVVQSDRGAAGLLVDRVHTQREVVVHPMKDPLIQVPGISGATELGDGRPVLILDALALTSGPVRPRSAASRAASFPARLQRHSA